MKRNFTIFVLLVCGLFAAAAAHGQGWPLPAAPGGAVQSCAGCPSPRTNFNDSGAPILGDPVYPYGDPIVAFTGRYLDSVFTRDYQQTFRTARAYGLAVNAEKNRLYMTIGSAVAAYNLDTFFARLEARDPLTGAGALGIPNNARPQNENEMVLKWNKFFYAENTPSGWHTPIVDGQERLSGFEWDDRGYIYLAYSYFGWGIVKDDFLNDGGLMQSLYQAPGDSFVPGSVVPLKTTNGKYYLFVGDRNAPTMRVFDVSNPSAPVRLADYPTPFTTFARAGDRIAILQGGKVLIYTNDDLVGRGAPINTFSLQGNGPYKGLTTDGTNFYAAGRFPNGTMAIATFTRNASGTFSELVTSTGKNWDPYSITHGSGHLAVYGQNLPDIGGDGMLLRLVNGVPQEISLNTYISKHYARPPAGYSKANRSILVTMLPHRQAGSLYLIVSAYGLGDVYKLKSDDAIAVAVEGTAGGLNPNAPLRASGEIFYGDKVAVRATTSGSGKAVTWNWGNPEAPDNVDPNGFTGVPAYHTYSGLTPATLGGTRTITGTAPTASATATITLKAPVARFGIAGTSLLFTQANASSPAPIVLGDTFIDASDGDLSGHYVDWKIDGASTNAMPATAVPVGNCGGHTLDFTTHYGFITSPGVLPSPDFAVTLSGGSTFRYAVQPYAAAIATPSVAGGNVLFTSASRFGAGITPASVNYTWELLNAAGGVVQTLTGNGANIASFPVPEATFATPGYRARLTLSSAATTVAGCTGFTSSVAVTNPVNYPDPVVIGDCANGSATACSFSVASASGGSLSGWTFSWSASGPGTVTNGTGSGTTLTPTFGATGTYTVSVTATNNGLSRIASKQVAVTSAPQCPSINMNNLYIAYTAGGAPCPSGVCPAGQIRLYLQSQGYDFACGPHTYTWKVNGATVGTTQELLYTFSAGQYNVTCEVNNGTLNTLTTQVNVGTVQQPPPVNPPPVNPPPVNPGGCPQMNALNIFIGYNGAGCSQNNSSQACAANQQMNFSAMGFNYDFGCANHTYSWSFGGQQKSGKDVTHTFTQSGLVPVSVTVNNGTQSYTATANINVSGGGQPPTGQCGTMSPSTVFLTYSNANGSCGNNSINPCGVNDNITFQVTTSNYNLSCANHTYTWSVDGGAGQSGGASIQRAFAGGGAHNVSVTISNGSQSYTASTTVNVGTGPTGNCPQMNGTNIFMSYKNANNTCNVFGGNACSTNEQLTFEAMGFNYDFSCGNHSYTWDFPGGVQKSGKSVTHAFASAGAQPVKLTVNNGSQTLVLDGSITIGGSTAPVLPEIDLDFVATPVAGIPNTFMFVLMVDPASEVDHYDWDFGDGRKELNRKTTAPFAHSYDAPGTYIVTVTAYYRTGHVLKTASEQVGLVSKRRGARH